MRKWTKTAGIIFAAVASVYAGQAGGGKSANAATPPTAMPPAAAPSKPAPLGELKAESKAATPAVVKAIDPTIDPFSSEPTTQPMEVISVDPNAKSVSPAQVLVNPDGTFSLNITAGADLVEQLRVIGFQAQKSIIPTRDVRGALPAMDLYNVTVREALDAILHVNALAWREKGNFIYVYTAKEIAEQEKAARVVNTEVFRVYYTPAADAVNMIKPVLSGDAVVSLSSAASGGLSSGATDTGGNSHSSEDTLVVTDYPENLERARKLIKEIDRRPQQILIEATILRAALTEDNALGVDFTVLGGVDFSTLTTNNNVPSGGAVANPTAAPGNNKYGAGTGGSFTNGIANGLKLGFVSSNFSVFLSALEDVTDTVVLANPKVLALNKQKGEVIVGRKDGYITTTVSSTTSTQTVEFLDTGTRLIFRPFIGDDGYIRMEIHPEDSSGGLTAANLPFKITTEFTGNIMVKDGRTIVIGGLFRESSDTSRSQVPFLGNLPLAGPLFRQQRDRTTREEIIILLTPHIVKDDVAYSKLSQEELNHGEKLRVGVRKGMMPWGRGRMAESFYESAVSEMNKPNPDRGKAVFFLDCATNLQPKFAEAMDMKQDLTGKQVSAVDNSSIRSFVRRSMLADNAPTTRPASSTLLDPPSDSKGTMTMAPAQSWPGETKAVAPTVAMTSVATTPATMPTTVPMAASLPMSSPATQPVTADAGADEVLKAMAEPDQATAPKPSSAVTELPMDDVIAVPTPDASDASRK